MRRCHAPAALPLSDLGHCVVDQRAVGGRHAAGPSGTAEGGRVVVVEADENRRGLDHLLARRGAGRVVFPIRKRTVSRCGRFGGGVDGVADGSSPAIGTRLYRTPVEGLLITAVGAAKNFRWHDRVAICSQVSSLCRW